jgi:hypothetical protein
MLRYELAPSWPPLAWLAVCRGQTVTVHHGRGVETMPEWFCEATWGGEYPRGDFDLTDIVAGSGGRLRGDRLTFVSSGSTVDRLHAFRDGATAYVSNSLVGLLATCGLGVDPLYPDYGKDLLSIRYGLEAVRPTLGPVTLTYFSNLQWAGGHLSAVAKPPTARAFTRFADYRAFLTQALRAIGDNMRHPARRLRYESLGTLSSGYDSSTVTVLAREALGLNEVLTFARARGGDDDSGERIADVLGVKAFVLDRETWRDRTDAIVPFLVGSGRGEDVNFAAAEHLLPGRVLFTGYHGDKVWDTHTTDLGPEIVRGDATGLSLTEYRLWTGFLHCPVPFFGVRKLREIHAISTSPEMAQWDVGGDYSRPICRRIVEEAGVPRPLFGTAKRASSVVIWNPKYDASEPLLPAATFPQYRRWLVWRTGAWLRRGHIPPLVEDLARRLLGRAGRTTLVRPLFPWAVEGAMRRYR